MAFIFTITQLACDTTNPTYPNCVTTVYWQATKSTATINSSTQLGAPNANFTQFSALTEAEVQSWLNLDNTSIEAALDAYLAPPPIQNKPVPWA